MTQDIGQLEQSLDEFNQDLQAVMAGAEKLHQLETRFYTLLTANRQGYDAHQQHKAAKAGLETALWE